MADRLVRIVLVGDSSGAVRALKSTEVASEQTTKKLEEHGGRQYAAMEVASRGSHRLAMGMGVLAGAVGVGAYAIAGMVRGGISLQEQQAQLQGALTATGINSKQNFDMMATAAENMAQRGGFATQENIQALTQFTRVTHNARAATNLLGLATDVARGSHKDLLQVTKALSLAEQGRTTGLSRLGIVVPKGATPQQAMALVQSRYGGAAAAFSNTAAGGLSNLKQGWDVLKEKVGQAFLPLVGVLTKTLTSIMPSVSKMLTAIAGPLSSALSKLLPPLMNVLQALIPPLLALAAPIANAIQSVMPAILGLIRTVAPIFTRALNVLLPPLIHVFNTVVPIITGVFARIGPPLMAALATVLTALAPVIVRFVQVLAPIFPLLANAIARIMPPLANAIASLMPSLTLALTTLLPPFVKAFDLLVPPLTKALVELMPAITWFANAIKSILNWDPFGSSPVTNRRFHRVAGAFPATTSRFGPVISSGSPPPMHTNAGRAYSGDVVIHHHTHLDGRQIAESVVRHSRRQAALG